MQDAERAVRETDERWIAAFNARDVDTLVSIYAPDVVVMPPGSPSLVGRPAVRAFLERFFESCRARQTLVNEEVVVCGEWAFLRGHFTLVIEPAAGGGTIREEGKHLVIWRRQPDRSWKAARDIWNAGGP